MNAPNLPPAPPAGTMPAPVAAAAAPIGRLASLQRGPVAKPPRILIYGVQGVGKSTFCNGAPNPIFITTEDGLGSINATSFPLCRSFQDVLNCLDSLLNEPHDFQTVVLDSLDWLEPMLWKAVATQEGKASIEEFGYGKGYVLALDAWAYFLNQLERLREEKGMIVILTAHADVKRFDDPDKGSYNRYNIKLHTRAGEKVMEAVDCVFFANYQVVMKTDEVGFNQKKNRAMGNGQRLIHTQERPAYVAKNRYSLPDSIPLDANTWGHLAQTIPYFQKFNQ